MAEFPEELMSLFTKDVFKKLLYADSIKIGEVSTIVALLIKAHIDFDLSFSSGSRRDAAGVEFTIYIDSNKNLTFTIAFEPGATTFD